MRLEHDVILGFWDWRDVRDRQPVLAGRTEVEARVHQAVAFPVYLPNQRHNEVRTSGMLAQTEPTRSHRVARQPLAARSELEYEEL